MSSGSWRRIVGGRRWALGALLGTSILVAAAISGFAAGCGGDAVAATVRSAAPSPPPAWLLSAAQTAAATWGDSHPTVAYWGLLHDPELGRLTGSGPDDPSHHAYVIVLVGDYSKIRVTESVLAPRPGTSPSPLPPVKWILETYTSADSGVGCYGSGSSDFDASQFPSLQPLAL